MPRSTFLFRLSVMAAVLVAASGTTRGDEKAAKAANDKRAEIQKALAAAGKEPGKTLDRQRLRIDAFESAGNQVRVVGVFLDTGELPGKIKDGDKEVENPDGWSPAFIAARQDAEAIVKSLVPEAKDAKFVWTAPKDKDERGVVRVGFQLPDRVISKYVPPHLLVQHAANVAGGETPTGPGKSEADRFVLTGARFGEKGQLAFVGIRDKDEKVLAWLTDEGAKAVPADHPALLAGTKPDWSGVAPVTWTVAAPDLQNVFAGSTEERQRALFVDRVYATARRDDKGDFPITAAGWGAPQLRAEGFQFDPTDPGAISPLSAVGALSRALGQAEGSGLEARWLEAVVAVLDETAKADATAFEQGVRTRVIQPAWNAMTAKTPAEGVQVQSANDLISLLPEPVRVLQRAVTEVRRLDGVRVDPGFHMGPGGVLLLGGIEPQLTPGERATLEKVAQGAIANHAKDARLRVEDRRKYTLLARRPVSTAGMTALPINRVRDALRDWAIRNKDDVRLRRLFFVEDTGRINDPYAVAPKGGGLVLVYQVAGAADGPEVAAEFTRLFRERFPEGIPGGYDPAPASKEKAAAVTLRGLTAELRRRVGDPAEAKKKWYGVFVERGYFDADDRYTLRGAVDRGAQNADLDALLADLSKDDRYKPYFLSHEGEPLPASPTKLAEIPMKGLVERLRRVLPAYPEFDGLRVTDARYALDDADKQQRLVLEAHWVRTPNPESLVLLGELLLAHPKYRDRVVKVPAPAGRTWAKVRFEKVAGPVYPGEWLGNFSEGYGAELLAKGEMEKAEQWLEVGRLHYPHLSGVWFLSAYYHYLKDDAELVERDLKRVVDLEVLQFNGDERRRARYEVAKDLQGAKRVELEKIWERRYREVKDGAGPITLVPGVGAAGGSGSREEEKPRAAARR